MIHGAHGVASPTNMSPIQEVIGRAVAQVADSIVHLSNPTRAEYFDAFVDVNDVWTVVVRVAGR